jgi:hypothetical protein
MLYCVLAIVLLMMLAAPLMWWRAEAVLVADGLDFVDEIGQEAEFLIIKEFAVNFSRPSIDFSPLSPI